MSSKSMSWKVLETVLSHLKFMCYYHIKGGHDSFAFLENRTKHQLPSWKNNGLSLKWPFNERDQEPVEWEQKETGTGRGGGRNYFSRFIIIVINQKHITYWSILAPISVCSLIAAFLAYVRPPRPF